MRQSFMEECPECGHIFNQEHNEDCPLCYAMEIYQSVLDTVDDTSNDGSDPELKNHNHATDISS